MPEKPITSTKEAEVPKIIVDDKRNIPKKPDGIEDETKLSKYHRINYLGKGGYAKCFEVEEEGTKIVYACKAVNKDLVLHKKRNQEKMRSEVQIHSRLNHDNIVRFYKAFEDDEFVYVLMEICRSNTLKELLTARKYLTIFETQYFVYRLLKALDYLHSNNIIHRDIKLANVLLNDFFIPKLADFGLAAQMKNSFEKKSTMCGTPNYIAPEILDGKGKGHNTAVDMWSLGIIIYALLLGYPPFETSKLKVTYKYIKKNHYHIPEEFEKEFPEASDLIRALLNGDPEKRLNAKQAMEHPFFRTYKMSFIPKELILSSKKRQSLSISSKGLSKKRLSQPSSQREKSLSKKSKESNPEEKLSDITLSADELKVFEKNEVRFFLPSYILNGIPSQSDFNILSPEFTDLRAYKVHRARQEAKETRNEKHPRPVELKVGLGFEEDILMELMEDPSLSFSLEDFLERCYTIDRFIDYTSKYGWAYNLTLNIPPNDIENKIKSLLLRLKLRQKNQGVLAFLERSGLSQEDDLFNNKSIDDKVMELSKSAMRLTETVGGFFNDDSSLHFSVKLGMYIPSPHDEIHANINKDLPINKVKLLGKTDFLKEMERQEKGSAEKVIDFQTKEVLGEEVNQVFYNIGNAPEKLRKKNSLMKFFRRILFSEQPIKEIFRVFVHKITQTEHGPIFTFSNGNILGYFVDKSQLLMSLFRCSKTNSIKYAWVVFLNKENERVEVLTDLEDGLIRIQREKPSMHRRIRFCMQYYEVHN